jgi:hypothetical protein
VEATTELCDPCRAVLWCSPLWGMVMANGSSPVALAGPLAFFSPLAWRLSLGRLGRPRPTTKKPFISRAASACCFAAACLPPCPRRAPWCGLPRPAAGRPAAGACPCGGPGLLLPLLPDSGGAACSGWHVVHRQGWSARLSSARRRRRRRPRRWSRAAVAVTTHLRLSAPIECPVETNPPETSSCAPCHHCCSRNQSLTSGVRAIERTSSTHHLTSGRWTDGIGSMPWTPPRRLSCCPEGGGDRSSWISPRFLREHAL